MNRKHAWHALRMSKVEDIVLENLVRVDEDTYLYTDYNAHTQYTVVDTKQGGKQDIQVTAIPFAVVMERLDQELERTSPLVRDYEADSTLEEIGICSVCGQPHSECVCDDNDWCF